ncbi:2-oxoacid:ferredoxin oxidoreductase subunit beta [Mobilicoccus caccae]|uniref:2-oxoglutarate ferredoxin oxidoreductase subunit beta n=1 Tax=Mobilicoccus caccae TaxID=1859295 RepID=A0ABQ6ISE7_9MICO|nr:2-oxoacid:ferredoxin oxidoreductase subunit beta [Mobilicoccus caccae]GMA40616.1 2-oxoglutarate ferredoxin oxidoreductase subunit beta [Mobilicoccus caccae]
MTIDLGMPTSGLHGIPRRPEGAPPENKKDYTSDQEVRWCPGCGDYAVLAGVQSFLPTLGLRRENIVFVSGIGCSSRFPYYLDTYGMHSVHGRAPSIATGLAVSRPDLSVWVVTGDGDALSIGGNHLIHALRRNVNLTILLFNNRIYGLTKGQYSPTSAPGLVTKSSPAGSVDPVFNPVALALGAGATFVARTMDSDRTHLTATLKAAAEHRGAALVEIYQNCPIFNDGAFEMLKDKEKAEARILRLEQGQPVRAGDHHVVVRDPAGGLEVVGARGADEKRILVHDATREDPTSAFGLAQLDGEHVPLGIFRRVSHPTYDDLVRGQVASAVADNGGAVDDEDIAGLLAGKDTWTVA